MFVVSVTTTTLYDALNGSVYVEIATALGEPDDAISVKVDFNWVTFNWVSPAVDPIPENTVNEV